MLEELGLGEAPSREAADVIVFNTCTIREKPDTKFAAYIGDAIAQKRRQPDTVIAVGGCYAEAQRERLFSLYPEVDVAFGPGSIPHLGEWLGAGGFGVPRSAFGIADERRFAAALPMHRERRFQAWVQISMGCNSKCAYCIVPVGSRARGVAARRRDPRRGGGARGARACARSRCSARTSTRGAASSAREFGALLRACDAVDGIERIRFTSPHPKDFRRPVIEAMAECDAVCEHTHLPLQSGSTRVLKAMRRTYSRERYLRLVDELRAAIPDLALTTDIIVGFPGETEDDFRETLEVVEEVGFDGAFTFVYSPRQGTEAAAVHGSGPGRGEARAHRAARRGRAARRARAQPGAHRPRRGGARRGTFANGSVAASRSHAAEHDRELRRRRAARRARRRRSSRARRRRRFTARSALPLPRSRDLDWDGCLNVRDLGGHRTSRRRRDALRRDRARRQRPPADRRRLGEPPSSTACGPSSTCAWTPSSRPIRRRSCRSTSSTSRSSTRTRRRSPKSRRRPRAARRQRFGDARRSISCSSSASARMSPRRSRRSRARPRAASSCIAWAARTAPGLLVALLLHVAGVDDEQIAADYALSEERLRPRHEAWLAEAGTEAERERIRRIAATPAESMLGVLEELGASLRKRRGVPPCGRRRRRGAASSCASGCVADTVLAIYGPTASGKTAVAEAVTQRIPAEVVSADAAALFRGLEVLTAAPEYPARLVGVFDVEHDVSVGEFQRLAHEAIDDVLAGGRTPVVVGGTGLYLRAALSDLAAPASARRQGVRQPLGSVLRRARRRARARPAADARSGGRRARPSERPAPRRARPGARRGRLDARGRRACGAERPGAADADLRARRSRRRARAAHSCARRLDARARGRRRGARGPRASAVAIREEGHGPRRTSPSFPPRRRATRSSRTTDASRAISGSGCGGCRISSPLDASARPGRDRGRDRRDGASPWDA